MNDADRTVHPWDCTASEKEPCKPQLGSLRTELVHTEERNRTAPDLLTRENILALWTDMSVAKPAWLPVTEHLAA